MIDPIIFSFRLFNLDIVLRWYGVLVMFGAVVGAFIAEREIKRRGENGDVIWDAMVWVLPFGILGARLWYVASNVLSGSTYYTENPSFWQVINTLDGGLHFFGGLLFGGITLIIYLKKNGYDVWLFLDSIVPAVFIGQALARPANFINQELYGPPTSLPWGIKIDPSQLYQTPANMIGHNQQEVLDYIKVTRFHPTFAYEMILNILLALLLLWIARQYKDKIKPGAILSGWLVLAGLARAFIEIFRPDQPRIGSSFISYTMLVSFLMAVAGVVMLLVRNRKLAFAIADRWEEKYQVKRIGKEPRVHREKAVVKGVAVLEKVDKVAITEPDMNLAVPEGVSVILEAKEEVVAVPEKKPVVKTKAPAGKKPVVKAKAPAGKKPVVIAKAPVKKAPDKKPLQGKKTPAAKKPAVKVKAAVKKISATKAPATKKPVVKAIAPVTKPTNKKVPAKRTETKSKSSK